MKTNTFFSIVIGTVLSTFTFAQNSIRAEITKADITCFGQANGKAELYIAGGQAPYSIQWNNGETTASIENLKKGTYAVTITDANGLTTTESVNIDMPKPIAITYNTPVLTAADNFNAKLNVMITGGSPWENTITNQNMYFVRIDGKSYYENPENIPAGKHLLSIEDAQGCALSLQANIAVHLAGETTQTVQPIEGLGTIDMTVFPTHLANQTTTQLNSYN